MEGNRGSPALSPEPMPYLHLFIEFSAHHSGTGPRSSHAHSGTGRSLTGIAITADIQALRMCMTGKRNLLHVTSRQHQLEKEIHKHEQVDMKICSNSSHVSRDGVTLLSRLAFCCLSAAHDGEQRSKTMVYTRRSSINIDLF